MQQGATIVAKVYITLNVEENIFRENLSSRRLMPVHFLELNVNHYYIYFRAAIMQLIFGVKLRSGGSRKRSTKHLKQIYW